MSSNATNATVHSNVTTTPPTGVLDGMNPVAINTADPVVLFIIQASIIIIVCRILNIALSKLRQPRVIAEVIGGIILGPSVMGQIPNFSNTVFPPASLPYLSLVANIGLILFLFLVGLEVDIRLMRKNAKAATLVSAAGLILPFGLGAAASYGIYQEFGGGNVGFGKYLLFTGVAMAITAFPVLARILTELKLLNNTVGVLVLAAGVGNDVVGWILLALTVALVNAGSGITALYVLLLAIGWTLILFILVRPVFRWLCIRSGSLDNGPSQGVMVLTLLLVFASAFVTNIIGVHAIFGGFLVGLIIPHDGGFRVKITEKIEDLISVFFLPLYFALSGLKTNLGLLDDGVTWGYVILIIVVAFFGKVTGCCLAAKAYGFVWREALAIGVLMSCKGLVELIVLNIGLQAKILSTKTFTMFVVMALVTTFATTPLTVWIYPEEYRRQREAEKRGFIGKQIDTMVSGETVSGKGSIAQRLLVVITRIEYLPTITTLMHLLQPSHQTRNGNGVSESLSNENGEKEKDGTNDSPLTVNALKLVELSERTSAAMKASDITETAATDGVLNTLRTIGHLHGINVNVGVSIVSEDDFSRQVVNHAMDTGSQLVLVPWAGAGAVFEDKASPLEHLFGPREVRHTSPHHGTFIRNLFRMAPCNVGVLIDRGFGIAHNEVLTDINGKTAEDTRHRLGQVILPGTNQRIVIPFFGGPDDREAVRFAAQLCRHEGVSATIIRFIRSNEPTEHDTKLTPANDVPPAKDVKDDHQLSIHRTGAGDPTIMHQATADKLASETADELLLSSYFGADYNHGSKALSTYSYSSRFSIEKVNTSTPLQAAVLRARNTTTGKDLVILGCGRQGGSPHQKEIVELLKNVEEPHGYSDVRKALGYVAEAMLAGGVNASLLIMQATRHQQQKITNIKEIV